VDAHGRGAGGKVGGEWQGRAVRDAWRRFGSPPGCRRARSARAEATAL
jgi:hypothetical protein